MSLHEKKNVRAKTIELYSREIKIDKSKDGDVYWNGEDNMYPTDIERVVLNSPTARRASNLMAKYIAGKGLVNENEDIIVNTRKNYRLSNVAALIAGSISKQYGAFIHVAYGFNDDGELVQKELDVLDYDQCRIAKEDDEGYEGKIFFRDYTKKQSYKEKKANTKWYYPYNPIPDVVRAQIKADYGSPIKSDDDLLTALAHYRGQVFYLNLTPEYKYALPPWDSVFNDADSEYRISVYTNGQVRSGFLGKVSVITQGIDEEKAGEVEKDIANWLGAENSDGVYHLNVGSVDDINQVIKVEQYQGQYNEKMFTETNKRLRTNICGAFNNIPEQLIFAPDGALFSTSADTYEQMKLFYSEQTEDERYRLTETLGYLGFPCEIKPIVERKTLIEQPSTETNNATTE